KQTQRNLDHYEDIKASLDANDQPIPSGLRKAIVENRDRIRELDKRIATYGRLTLHRIKERLKILENSPGSSFYRNQINEIHRAVFRFERKLDERGKDFRPELLKIQSMLVTLEKDSGIVLT